MTRAILILTALCVLTGCGIRRPLMLPQDIPAYEEKQRKKRERFEADQAADALELQQQQQEQTQPPQAQ